MNEPERFDTEAQALMCLEALTERGNEVFDLWFDEMLDAWYIERRTESGYYLLSSEDIDDRA